eukprot:TRINITY_DN6528_c0_g3_i2.p1 TRINITY_DN6528_c0_g3~~TRINITY_DN6528_c0_g3_i2.p1  ORF type:complete len:597 (+),score=88.84 TRINITY_DN6528_c0_g3_i2:275-2065(+)
MSGSVPLTMEALQGVPVGHVTDPAPLSEDVQALTRGEVAKEHVPLADLRDDLLSRPGGDVAYSLARDIRKDEAKRRRVVLSANTTDPSQTLKDEWETKLKRMQPELPPSLANPMRRSFLGRRGSVVSLGSKSVATIFEAFGGQDLRDGRAYSDSDCQSSQGEAGEDEPLLPSQLSTVSVKGGNSDTATFLTLVKACCGPAHLYLAKGLANAGVWTGVVGLALCCLLNAVCVTMLVNAQHTVRSRGAVSSFAGIGKEAFKDGRDGGKGMYWAVEASLIASQMGLVTMYFIFVGQTIISVLGVWTNCALWVAGLSLTSLIVVQAGVQMPMALLRHLHQIAFFAIVADVLILGGMSCVMYDNVVTIASGIAAPLTTFRPNTVALFIGTSILTFEGIGLMLPIHDAMENPQNFTWLMSLAFAMCCVLFIVFALLGYVARGGDAVDVNLLIAMPEDSSASQFAKVLYSLAVMLTFPLQAFPAYRIVEIGLGMASGKHNVAAKWRKNFLRLATVSALGVVAWGAGSHLDNFVAILGGLTMCPLAFVFPSLFHYKLCAETSAQKATDLCVFVLGLVIVVFVTSMAVYDWIFKAPDPPAECIAH